MFQGSICEYKNRQAFGRSDYRGNTTGGIISDFLDFSHHNRDGLFVDPMVGGGTSRDVASEKGIRFKGFDLHSGFNIVRDDLGAQLHGERAESIFIHPPYWQMIRYSDHPDDLSNGTLDEFLKKLQLAMMNVFDALRPGGMYGVLMGNWRRKGFYHPLCALTMMICPGKLREELIKVQHNCTSDRRNYVGAGTTFVPIRHETLYIFQKDATPKILLDFASDFSGFLGRMHHATWRNVIVRIFQREQRSLSLDELYELVSQGATEKTLKNQHWRAKVRQVVGRDNRYIRVGKGTYVLKVS